ncbi:GFA family protein [Phenylobacterium sp.]|uniref:GFA family protein n=1 Tax=Phenylobacterium sp. TaxID=1871053 RepID=UPI00356ADE20
MDLSLKSPSCVCGRVVCEAVGAPILSAVCYCEDCQEGGARIEALPGAARVRDADGGTSLLIYRDDRFRCVSGADLLVDYRLKAGSPTRRVVASCCNSGLFLKFGPGHWVSAYRNRFEGDLPPVEMRTSVRRRRAEGPFPDNAPTFAGFPPRLLFKLLGARIAMLLGR